MAVLAPMARAMVAMATAAKPGRRRRPRTASRKVEAKEDTAGSRGMIRLDAPRDQSVGASGCNGTSAGTDSYRGGGTMGNMRAVLAGACSLMAAGGVSAQEGAGAKPDAGGEPCRAAAKKPSVPALLSDLCVGTVALGPYRLLPFTVRHRGSRSTTHALASPDRINGEHSETIELHPLGGSHVRRPEAR